MGVAAAVKKFGCELNRVRSKCGVRTHATGVGTLASLTKGMAGRELGH